MELSTFIQDLCCRILSSTTRVKFCFLQYYITSNNLMISCLIMKQARGLFFLLSSFKIEIKTSNTFCPWIMVIGFLFIYLFF